MDSVYKLSDVKPEIAWNCNWDKSELNSSIYQVNSS